MAALSGEDGTPGMDFKFWAIYDDGTCGRFESTQPDEPVLPKPGRFVTETEYQVCADAMAAAHQAYLDQLAAEDLARTKADYDELRALGVSDAAARRMSGYTGP